MMTFFSGFGRTRQYCVFVSMTLLALSLSASADSATLLVSQKSAQSEQSTPIKKIILTLDDGFQDQEGLMTMLKAHHAGATFFIEGTALKAYPAIWKDAQDKGFLIGCHTMSHHPTSQLSGNQFRTELREWRALAKAVLGEQAAQTTLFRFPYGDTGGRRTKLFKTILKEEGFSSYLWDIDISTPYHKLPPAIRIEDAKDRLEASHSTSPIVLGHFTYVDVPAIEEVLEWAEMEKIVVEGLGGAPTTESIPNAAK